MSEIQKKEFYRNKFNYLKKIEIQNESMKYWDFALKTIIMLLFFDQ